MNARRETTLLALALVALLVAAAWSYARLSASRAAAATAAADLEGSRVLASRIEAMRGRAGAVGGGRDDTVGRTPRAEADPDAAGEMSLRDRIGDATDLAEIDDEQVTLISPEPPRRAGGGPLLEVATRVTMEDVTMSQLFAFLHALADAGPGEPPLHVTHLRVSEPRWEDEEAEGDDSEADLAAADEAAGAFADAGDESDGADEEWAVELTFSYFVRAADAGGAGR